MKSDLTLAKNPRTSNGVARTGALRHTDWRIANKIRSLLSTW
jgi:hypothetical protein